MRRAVLTLSVTLFLLSCLHAADHDRDFSGTWLLDRNASNSRELGAPEESLTITADERTIEWVAGNMRWSIPLEGSDRKCAGGSDTWNSASKWEGAALLINTLVTGARDYTIMDRWRLSRDHETLTITRQLMRSREQFEGQLVYRHPGAAMSEPRVTEARPASGPLPVLVRRPEVSDAAPAVREFA